jgi:hypothetical protein
MKDRLVVMGSALCLEADLIRLLGESPDAHEAWDFLAVGLDCADRYLGRIEHAVSYHPKEFAQFRERREKAGGNLDYVTHSHSAVTGVDRVWPYFSPSGSSAMLGVEAGIGMGYRKIVVAGVLLEEKEYRRFQEGWKVRFDRIKDFTRAMGGYPLELLGAPTQEWLSE